MSCAANGAYLEYNTLSRMLGNQSCFDVMQLVAGTVEDVFPIQVVL